jgi:membrane protease YdiL (CAAX protease family)
VGSLLAMAIGGAAMLRRRSSEQLTPDGGLPISLPWSVPSQTRYELLEATAALLAAFLLSGCVGSSLSIALDGLVGIGVPLTPSASQALQVLGSHTAWVLLASHVLGSRLKPFFHAGQWFRISWRSHWLAWVVGGYVASVASYAAVERFTDVLLRVALPAASAIRESELDSVVSALASPQQRSGLFSLLVGCIAPCVTAPIFEEVLYRGFVLPALLCFVPLTAALPLHALLFGLHHRSLATLLPLSTLGLLWAALYVRSRNLLVPMLVHALWNCRVFALAYWEL